MPDTVVPPPELSAAVRPNSVTQRAGGYSGTMKTLPVLRQIPASTLRSNALTVIGRTKVNFRPMLDNPRALTNIAQKLRGLPQLVEVRTDIMEAMEVKQGLVIHSLLTYRFRPGACRDAQRRAQVAATGGACFARMGDGQHAAAFADPKDAHFVANPTLRAQAMATAKSQSEQIAAGIAQNVAEFRANQNNPLRRSEMTAAVGAAELARLISLDDNALAGELANTAETKIEQVAYVPRTDSSDTPASTTAKPASNAPKAPIDVDVNFDIGSYVFLTGFTLGREYEWTQRVETTISWCLVGCKSTYYAELSAGFSYGFGLRFPLRFGGTFNFNRTSGVETAKLTASLAPIDGNTTDYSASGLDAHQLFSGKELVAEVQAHAGAAAKLPYVGTLGPVNIKLGKDFTEGLPAPFTNGQFAPPAPGETGPELIKVFDDFDLIGGLANFGVLGGQVFPAIKAQLHSDEMHLTLHDKVKGTTTLLKTLGQIVPLGVDPSDQSSSFTVDDPVYALSFLLTPGLTARLFIDLAVWGTHWDWPVWFPQLGIDLPGPGGVKFACHDGTVCSRDFRFTPKGTQTPFEGDLEKWAKDFEAEWKPQCLDETCEVGIGFIRTGIVFDGQGKAEANPNIVIADLKPVVDQAKQQAKAVVTDSLVRKSQSSASSFAILAQATWAKQCQDKICFDAVKILAGQMVPRSKQIALANPEESSVWTTQQVLKEFAPKYSKEVTDSKARIAAQVSMQAQRTAKNAGKSRAK